MSPSQVRDFRGAMEGRADKGIIITTGTFTAEARKEALRDGARPIELVDGQKLIEMFEHLQLGLKPIKAFQPTDLRAKCYSIIQDLRDLLRKDFLPSWSIQISKMEWSLS